MLTVVESVDTQLWDVERVAGFLGVSVWWVYRKSNAGVIPCRRIGKALKFFPSQIIAWANSQPTGGAE